MRTNEINPKVRLLLQLSDRELTSNWTKLAQLICAYEDVNWTDARQQANELLLEKKAKEYLQYVRANADENPRLENELKQEAKTDTENQERLNRFQKNYNRLLKIAPDIEREFSTNQILRSQELKGKSHVTGYDDLYFELLKIQGYNYIFSLSAVKRSDGEVIPSLKMILLFDIENFKLEALSFENSHTKETVYDDLFRRKMLNEVQKEQQNNFLTTWLKELLFQEHRIEWYDDFEDEDTENTFN